MKVIYASTVGERTNLRVRVSFFALVLCALSAAHHASAQSIKFLQNANSQHDYARHTTIPAGFGSGEFTLEVWLRPDNSFPVGSVSGGSNQLTNWSDSDAQPYSSGSWWFTGNFLLDGHNNGSFKDGTFSLQFVGGGRVRWDFGDGTQKLGGHWGIQAWPSSTTPSLLDGNWHYIACVRRWAGGPQETAADLELWIDGGLVNTQSSNVRTNMRTAYWNDWTGYPSNQQGWFWGSEKQAAVLTNGVTQYEDYKGLIDELRFWNRAKTSDELRLHWQEPVTGSESGLTGWYDFSEGSGTTTCSNIVTSNCMTLVRTSAANWSTQNAPVGGGNPPADPDYLYVDFNAASGGNGAQATPFNMLADAIAAANPSATIEIAPGSSSELLTISSALTIINGNPAGGAVALGTLARRAAIGLSRTGFVANR